MQGRELRNQREELRITQEEQTRSGELVMRELHTDLIKMAIEDGELRSVWPAPAPGEQTTRKYHYCNLILNLQKVAYETHTIELPELRNALRFLMTSPDMRAFWSRSRQSRVSITDGDDAEDTFTAEVDTAYTITPWGGTAPAGSSWWAYGAGFTALEGPLSGCVGGLYRVIGLPGVEELVGAQLPRVEGGDQFWLVVGGRGPDQDGVDVVVETADAVGLVLPVLQAKRASAVASLPALSVRFSVGVAGNRGDGDECPPTRLGRGHFGDHALPQPQSVQLVGGPSAFAVGWTAWRAHAAIVSAVRKGVLACGADEMRRVVRGRGCRA